MKKAASSWVSIFVWHKRFLNSCCTLCLHLLHKLVCVCVVGVGVSSHQFTRSFLLVRNFFLFFFEKAVSEGGKLSAFWHIQDVHLIHYNPPSVSLKLSHPRKRLSGQGLKAHQFFSGASCTPYSVNLKERRGRSQQGLNTTHTTHPLYPALSRV